MEGADGPRLYEVAELGRQRSRRPSCVSFSISQRDNQCDDEEGGEDDEISDEEVILVGRTNNEDHED